MTNTPGIQTVKFTVPAGDRINVAIPCEFIHCVASTGVFYVAPGGGNKIYFASNVQTRFVDNVGGFDLINESGADISGVLVVGFGEFEINNVSIGAPVLTQGASNSATSKVNVTAVATQIFAVDGTRTGWCICNTHATEILYIGEAGVTAANGFPIYPGEKHAEDGTGALFGIVAAGSVDVLKREVKG